MPAECSHGARPVHLIITMIRWIRTSRLSIKNSLSHAECGTFAIVSGASHEYFERAKNLSGSDNNYLAEMCSGAEEGSYLRLIDLCITQL